MSFCTPEFFFFLPCIVFISWICSGRVRLFLLLGGSYFFYMFFQPLQGILMGGITLFSFVIGILEGKTKSKYRRRGLLILGIVGVIAPLILYKYLPFFLHIKMKKSIIPVGLSFYTFQAISYLVDLYRGRLQPEYQVSHYALYISFFPQLVAGPIERLDYLLPQLKKVLNAPGKYHSYFYNIREALPLFLRGYYKKVILADYLADFVDPVYQAPKDAAGPAILLATFAFALQIYGDFSGYSDIARGCGKLLGVELSANFDNPYKAVGFRDFWHRWHISLSRWLTDYIYIPLGGNKNGTLNHCMAILCVFLISGFWHGAAWTFFLWGFLHGMLMIGETLWQKYKTDKVCNRREKDITWLKQVITFLVVCLLWMPFRAQSLTDLCLLLQGIFRNWKEWLHLVGKSSYNVKLSIDMAIRIAMLILLDRNKLNHEQRKGDVGDMLFIWILIVGIFLGLIETNIYGNVNNFIYFQF